MKYIVKATMHGKRISTYKTFNKKITAQRYADETNMYHRHARARVCKAR